MLVADDDRAIRESLARALELEGYDVATVADGVRTAIEHAGKDGVVCACGSLYMIGDIVAALDTL